MKNLKLIKSTGLMLCLFASLTLFFTSTITNSTSTDQTVAKLSADMAKVNAELAALKLEKVEGSSWDEPALGEITIFGGTFAPRGWAFCNGQLLSIAQNSALFSLLGTTYGGDGRTTFGLPDLRGRVPVHVGGDWNGGSQGPGLAKYGLGQKGGKEGLEPYKIQVSKDGGNNTQVIYQLNEDNRQPYLGVNYIIALTGDFPARS